MSPVPGSSTRHVSRVSTRVPVPAHVHRLLRVRHIWRHDARVFEAGDLCHEVVQEVLDPLLGGTLQDLVSLRQQEVHQPLLLRQDQTL